MRVRTAAIALMAFSTTAHAQGLPSLKSLRKAAESVVEAPIAPRTAAQSETRPSVESARTQPSNALASDENRPQYAPYIGRDSLYFRLGCDAVKPGQVQSDKCLAASKNATDLRARQCQALFTYTGSFATPQQKDHHQRMAQSCIKIYQADEALEAQLKSGAPTKGKGSVTRF